MRQVPSVAALILALLSSSASAEGYSTRSHQTGFNLPGVNSPSGNDEVRAADGTSCRSALGHNGAYVDVGGLASEDGGRLGAATVYGRVVIPLGPRPRRVDCRQLYDLEMERLRLEVTALRRNVAEGSATSRGAAGKGNVDSADAAGLEDEFDRAFGYDAFSSNSPSGGSTVPAVTPAATQGAVVGARELGVADTSPTVPQGSVVPGRVVSGDVQSSVDPLRTPRAIVDRGGVAERRGSSTAISPTVPQGVVVPARTALDGQAQTSTDPLRSQGAVVPPPPEPQAGTSTVTVGTTAPSPVSMERAAPRVRPYVTDPHSVVTGSIGFPGELPYWGPEPKARDGWMSEFPASGDNVMMHAYYGDDHQVDRRSVGAIASPGDRLEELIVLEWDKPQVLRSPLYLPNGLLVPPEFDLDLAIAAELRAAGFQAMDLPAPLQEAGLLSANADSWAGQDVPSHPTLDDIAIIMRTREASLQERIVSRLDDGSWVQTKFSYPN